jgi:uncharacterized protein
VGTGSLTLLDWRRQVAELYAAVRATDDAAQAHELWRRGRDRLFAEHPDSPLVPGDPRREGGLPVAPYDPALRFTAAVEPAEPQDLTVTTGTDGTVVFSRLGRARTPVGTLDLWWLTGYGGGLWLPVRDAGSGSTSYGGGRYLLDTVKGADLGTRPGVGSRVGSEELVLDLNFLYNPSCAYDPDWACPLAPPGNRVGAVLEAGELDLPH